MGDHPKYVVVIEGNLEVPIVFDCLLAHAQMVGGKTVVAAGFCSFGSLNGEVTVTTWGESVTLRNWKESPEPPTHIQGFASRPEDSNLIRRKFDLID